MVQSFYVGKAYIMAHGKFLKVQIHLGLWHVMW